MGIEPTPPADTARDYGFEDRGRHQPPSASTVDCSPFHAKSETGFSVEILSLDGAHLAEYSYPGIITLLLNFLRSNTGGPH